LRINYSKHAEEQLKEREMSKQLINNILLESQQVIAARKGRKIAQSIVELDEIRFLIRVIYIEEGEFAEIITVYKTTKIKNYWRNANEDTL